MHMNMTSHDQSEAFIIDTIIEIFKSNHHYTRGTTSKRATSGGIHLRSLASGQHSSEETSQRWRAVANTVPIWPARESNARPTALIAMCLTTKLICKRIWNKSVIMNK